MTRIPNFKFEARGGADPADNGITVCNVGDSRVVLGTAGDAASAADGGASEPEVEPEGVPGGGERGLPVLVRGRPRLHGRAGQPKAAVGGAGLGKDAAGGGVRRSSPCTAIGGGSKSIPGIASFAALSPPLSPSLGSPAIRKTVILS